MIKCIKSVLQFSCCAENFSLDNAPWLVRLVEVDSDEIETLIENNQCYTKGR